MCVVKFVVSCKTVMMLAVIDKGSMPKTINSKRKKDTMIQGVEVVNFSYCNARYKLDVVQSDQCKGQQTRRVVVKQIVF